MLFLISPAKTLDYQPAPPDLPHTLPRFTEHSTELIELLRAKTPAEIESLMSISPSLAALNTARYAAWTPQAAPGPAKQALLAFMGDVYEGLDAASLSHDELGYLQQRLRILSGLYGVLRPLDLMQPYRLEMGTRLNNAHGRDLYAFWGNRLTDVLAAELATAEPQVLVNLASNEYFKAVRPKQLGVRVVDCVFEDGTDGRYKIVSFYAKRARGLMVRFAAQRRPRSVEELQQFDLEGYRFVAEVSEQDRWVFRRDKAA
ncbi:peroxide stress protein YaaA [Chitinimonas lacunae]|uniref:UPF0246 protein ACFOW7_16925 n=1 Tax=Chitinimonas lacunae TaxID=1963018 RepID=A0ABV8MV84_9NEIS